MRSDRVKVTVDLGRVRENALSISRETRVDLIAVVKADAYGLGARAVVEAIADVVAGFCVFSLGEAIAASLWEAGHKPILALGPAGDAGAGEFIAAHVRPAVWNVQEATRLRAARPVLCVDTGMRRFACLAGEIDTVIRAGEIDEAFTHATHIEHVRELAKLVAGKGLRLHAAASALLRERESWLDAVRPGIALYRGAARVVSRLVEVQDGGKPAGYRGFNVERFGVILCGYSQGLRAGACLVNGKRRAILEVGMQTAFVEIGAGDRVGDEAVLLGESLTEADVGREWGVSEQQALLTLVNAGERDYR